MKRERLGYLGFIRLLGLLRLFLNEPELFGFFGYFPKPQHVSTP